MKLSLYLILLFITLQGAPAQADDIIVPLPQESGLIQPMVDFEVSLEIPDFKAAPETASETKSTVEVVHAKEYMIVTAHPLATQAGYDVLESGGTASDAAFAAQLVLGLVEPQSSGLGGGGFALYWDAQKKQLNSYDGRETAPASVTERHFLKIDGQPMDFYKAATGGRAVGVPGLPLLLEALYKHHGKLPKDHIFQPALELSKYGFMASPRLIQLIEDNSERLKMFKATKDYFLPHDAQPLNLNQNIQNLEYHNVLEQFNLQGAGIFYEGDIANNIIEAVNKAPHAAGRMTQNDFSEYQVQIRDPVCGKYIEYKVCSMGEPSSGGLTLIQILGLLNRFDLNVMQENYSQAWHLVAEASRLAFADRDQYMADADHVDTPGTALIDPAYIAVRSALIDPERRIKKAGPGIPLGWRGAQMNGDEAHKNTGTTHISVIDRYGNALSLTSSIETAFGSKIMVNGFLLNNQLTDFAFKPYGDGHRVANRAGPTKRPRSSMTPVIIFDEAEKPVMIIGAAGGSRIIGYVLQRILSVLNWNMPLDEALLAPHILSRGDGIEIEMERDIPFDLLTLKALGHTIERKEMNSGLSILYYKDDLWHGAADPRREGAAMGQ